MSKEEKTFKLVFSTDGTFLHAEDPDGNIAKTLSFNEMKALKLYDKRGDEASFKDHLLTGRRESIKFVDIPGHSICGGACGGVAFSWC